MSGHRGKTVFQAMAALGVVLLLLACDVSSLPFLGSQPPEGDTGSTAEETPAAKGAPTQAPAVKATQRPAQQPRDAQSRVSESLNRLVLMDKRVLKAYHLDVNGTMPVLNQQTKQVEIQTFTVKADVAGDDIYMVYTTKTGTKAAQTTEGYSIKGGISKSGEGGKEYEVSGGKLKESIGAVGLTWAFLPLNVGIPLAVAATGPSAQGEEAIDGRAAEKYGVDSANAPAGTMGILGGLLTITSAKGTVWIDKETGALLKLVLDYQQDFVDPPGSKTVVGKGSGHMDLVVTKVGKATVTLPK